MPLTSAEATVNIVPSMRGFQQRVRAGVAATRVDPLKVRVELDKQSLHKAEAEARAASERMAKARQGEVEAAEKVRLAEAKVSEARRKSAADSSQVIAAENRLKEARRQATAAASSVARAHADEARAKASVVSANNRLSASNERLRRSQQGLAGAMNSFRSVGSSINAAKREINQADRVLTKASMSAMKLGAYSTAAASALVGIGGATGPVLALGAALATAAGSAALIPAALAGAGASFATLKIGLGGISDAFKESGKAAEASGAAGAKSAEQQIQRARGIRDAQQSLAQAQTNAARVRADGERRVSDAMRQQQDTAIQGARSIKSANDSLISARRQAADAERDYRDAVKETILSLRDLKVELKSSSLSVEEAELNLDRARQRLEELRAAGSTNPLDMREAELSVRRANISLEESKNRYTDVARESAEANALGVEGARSVQDAARGVQDANKGVRDAEEELAIARSDAARANADAARAVVDAQRDAREANADAARQIQQAQEALADAYAKTGDSAQSAGDKAAEAMAKLSPNARAFVEAVLSMRGAWDDLKNSVQDRLFAGAADEVKALGNTYIPVLKNRLGEMADAFNRAARETSGYLRSAQGVKSVDNLLRDSAATSREFSRAMAPLTEVFVRIAEIGAPTLTRLAGNFADAAERARGFVNSAEGAARIKEWIENGVTALSQLGELLWNVGGIIGTVWRTMNEVGGSTLQLLVDLTGQANAWVKSAEGQEVLKQIFTTIRDVVRELEPGVKAVLGALKDAFVTLAPSLPGLARAFSDIVIALAPLVNEIATGLKWLIDNALIPFANWAKANPEAFREVARAIVAIVIAVKALNIAKKVTDWCVGISNAIGILRDGANKASAAVGVDGKSGLRGKLGALAKFGGMTIGITVLLAVMQELGAQGDALQAPVKGIPQKDRTIGQEARNVVGGELGKLNDNPLDAFTQNQGKTPFEWFFGRTPDEFADGVKNSLFGKLSEKFSGTVGKWMDENVAFPVQGFFKGLPARISGFSDAMGTWAETNIRQPIIRKASELGGNVRGFFAGLPATVSGWNDQLGTWAETNIREPVVRKFTELKDGAIARVTEAKDWVVLRFTELKDWVVLRATEARDWVSTRFRELKDWIVARATEARDWVVLRFTELKDWVVLRATEARDWVSTRYRELKDWIVARATEARDWVSTRYRELKDWIIARATEARDWVHTRMRELKDWIVARATEARDWVSTRYRELKDWIVLRATEARDWVHTRLRELKDWIILRATEARDWVSTRFREMKDWIIARATEARDWVVTRFRELKDGAIARVTEARDWVVTRARELKDGFIGHITNLVDSVGRKWDELRGFFAHPIKWVIDYVWNGTIADLWGKARGLIPSLPEFQRLATGGSVRGPGTATSDSIPAMLSNGEHVLTAREVRAMGGHEQVATMRQAALAGRLPAFASGGPVNWQDLWNGIRGTFPQARLTSSVRPGDPGYHGKGKAIDVAGPRSMDMPFMLNVNRWAANTWGKGLAELIHTQPGAVNLKNGRGHTYNAGTQADHRNHVHIAAGGGGLGSMIGGIWDAVSTFFRDSMAKIFDGPANFIRGELGKFFPGDTLANRIPRDGAGMILNGVRDFLFGAADEQDGMAGGGGIAAGGTGPVGDQVRAVANRFGWGAGPQWDALVRLIQKESSWNPNAQNPRSTAYGLFQFLNSTWGTVGGRKTSNPGEQAEYGLRYLRQRYRDPIGALAFHNRNNWYHNGGVIPGRGNKLVVAEGGERILSKQDRAAFDALVSRLPSTPGAVSQMQRGHGLAGVGSAPASSGRGALIENFHAYQTVDVDAALSRVSFLSGSP